MPLYPLDEVRNADVDRKLEPALEAVREEIARFRFSPDTDLGSVEEIIAAYDAARPRLNVLASVISQIPSGPGADIGTGIGFLPVALARLGVEVVATEREPAVSRFASAAGIEVRTWDIGRARAPIDPGSLDFVVLAEVLEHLKASPVAVLREMASLLRPGGLLLLTTPNVARLAHLEALAAGENFLEPFPENLPLDADATDWLEHVREYSIREVVDAIEAAGLSVDRVRMTGWGEAGYNPAPNPYSNEIIVAEARR